MIKHIVQEVETCLQNDCQIAALTLALTLPDACGKACYPELKNAERYKRWYNEYVIAYQKSYWNYQVDEEHFIKAEVVYKLRCALLHESNPTVFIKNQVENFALIWKTVNSCSRTPYLTFSRQNADGTTVNICTNIDIVELCRLLCTVANMYYQINKDKFAFNYRIVSMDDKAAQCFHFNNKIDI